MVKIKDNEYYCEWCGEKIIHNKQTAGKPKEYVGDPYFRSSGHGRVSSTLICSKCGRKVSQRMADGSK